MRNSGSTADPIRNGDTDRAVRRGNRFEALFRIYNNAFYTPFFLSQDSPEYGGVQVLKRYFGGRKQSLQPPWRVLKYLIFIQKYDGFVLAT